MGYWLGLEVETQASTQRSKKRRTIGSKRTPVCKIIRHIVP
jgi:hypothetical protein